MRLEKLKKMKNEKGASLALALFLFLLCMVVVSVVITAGTASSGRLSDIKEIDRSYYSVTSAAETVKGLIASNPVTFRQTAVTSGGAVLSVTTDVKDSMLDKAGALIALGKESDWNDTALWDVDGSLSSGVNMDFKMDHESKDSLDMVVGMSVNIDKTMTFTFPKDVTGAAVYDAFQLEMVCAPPTVNCVSTTNGDGSETYRDYTVTWNENDIKISRK